MIFGVDFSISCPCVCRISSTGKFVDSKFKFLSNRKRDISSGNIYCEYHKIYKTEQERYDHISNTMIQFMESEHVMMSDTVQVYIEDYAMGAKGLVFNIAECTGLFKHKVHQHNGWELIKVPPTVIKKFASGKGNADKDKMYESFINQGNPDIKKFYFSKPDMKSSSPVSDIVDAWFIALYGYEQYRLTLSTSV